ncbi:unnamed protein product [Rhizophagus irregularis]|nr:unnamed protein product [Rhizophagus irregularis]
MSEFTSFKEQQFLIKENSVAIDHTATEYFLYVTYKCEEGCEVSARLSGWGLLEMIRFGYFGSFWLGFWKSILIKISTFPSVKL